jgi:hypothetical protein
VNAFYGALRLDLSALGTGYLVYGWRGAIVGLAVLVLLQKIFALGIWVWSLFVPVSQRASPPPVSFEDKLDE